MYEIAYILLTYNQMVKKTIQTINSILLQKDTDAMIIIADDGSKYNYRKEIEDYLQNSGFSAYTFLENETNMGTVSNIYRCKEYCSSKYVKLISPGDLMYGFKTMRRWIDYMDEQQLDASVSNVFFYNDEEKFKVLKMRQCPCDIKPYITLNKRKIKDRMLIKNDLWLGAATLIRKDVLFEYLGMIVGKVKYGEDSIYRIMAADEKRISVFNHETVLYERGQGVTSESLYDDSWRNKLMQDWKVTTNLIIDEHIEDDHLRNRIVFVSNWKNKATVRISNVKKTEVFQIARQVIPLYFKMPSMLIWHLRLVMFSRYRENIDMEIVESIMKC